MSARATILDNLRSRRSAFPQPQPDFSVVQRKKWNARQRVSRLKRMMQAVHTEFVECERDHWLAGVQQVVAAKDIRTLMYGQHPSLTTPLAEWDAPATLQRIPFVEAFEQTKDTIFGVDAAITTTLGGIAETGSLIVWPNAQEPRTLSLVPKVHIALLDSKRIYNTLYEAITQEHWSEQLPTNALLISGPSKTADIEQTLVYGIHGCKELVVLLMT
jgi:L-lactate dehydrogenase complex protein LldG